MHQQKNDSIARFNDLAPVDNADPDGCYTKALEFAMTNDRIKNIAITGPYGSGKSSIIKTFEKISSLKFLHISLASFKEPPTDPQIDGKQTEEQKLDEEQHDEKQNILIERSILQQMLYGASANKLPYSRFKRISTPVRPLVKSIIFVLWIVSVYFLYSNKEKLFTGNLFSESFWGWSLLILFVLFVAAILVFKIYKSSFSLSFKKISLTNAEIETGDVSDNSILNRHLDEIIYFFQSTKYDVVVIEDLDRFGSPEIFVKLREINKLINDNVKITGKIKFLYALKDDMFRHKNRTKFFDFIIPVVPIINSSNSLDKMQERIKDEYFADKIEKQFLREVSLYVYDLRLIHNIFNEFSVYNAKLASDSLNRTKLLAMMIYKNVYPNDFELLHNCEGALYSISLKRSELIAALKQPILENISKIRDEIKKSKDEALKSIDELIKTFIGHLVIVSQLPVITVHNLTFAQLLNWENFKSLFNQQNINLQYSFGSYSQQSTNLQKSFKEIYAEISPNETVEQRKDNIENKTSDKRIKLEDEIRCLEKERNDLVQLPLKQLLQKTNVTIESILSEQKMEDPELFIYLVKNGYIDETYHMYTSNFHEGRLTRNDRDFLLAIRDFKKNDPNHLVDTPAEVCENMREEDFAHVSVLNVNIMDYILTESTKTIWVESAIKFISGNFNECEEFFTSYWNAGKNGAVFTQRISQQWSSYASVALNTPNASNHIAMVLSHVVASDVVDNMNNNGVLAEYLSEYGAIVFSSDLYSLSNYEVLKNLNVKFKDISSLKELASHLDFAHKHDLYEINQTNILYLMQRYSSNKDNERHESSNYSCLSLPGCEKIKEYVDLNLPEYIDMVFLLLPQNTKENRDAITFLLNSSAIDIEIKKTIISKQNLVFEDLLNIPVDFWEQYINEDKITPSWHNVSEYLEVEGVNIELLTEKIQKDLWLSILANNSITDISLDEEQKEKLSLFIYENDGLSERVYSALIKNLSYVCDNFPEVTLEKMIFLAQNRRVRLTEDSFATSEIDLNLKAILVEKNANEYFSSKEGYPINDNIREILLQGNLTEVQKIKICHDVTLAGINSNEKLLKIMTEILAPNGVDCSRIEKQVMIEIITKAPSTEFSLQFINKCIPDWDEQETMNVIASLPEPYSEITTYGRQPKLKNNEINRNFAELLKSKGFVSSVKEDDNRIQINTFRSEDHL